MESSATSERLTAWVPNLFCRSGYVAAPRRLSSAVSSAGPPLLQRSLTVGSVAFDQFVARDRLVFNLAVQDLFDARVIALV